MLKSPFPWFGGKSKVAELVWDRFGDVQNYCDCFRTSIVALKRWELAKMPPPLHLSGQVFGRLTAICYVHKVKSTNRVWLCRCECGTEIEVIGRSLTDGNTRSCGCLSREVSAKNIRAQRLTHGRTRTPEYYAWMAMKRRCSGVRTRDKRNYSDRGIIVDPLWRESFQAFFEHVGPRPSIDHSLDRIDNDGNYEPGNVRWATRKEQARNKTNNRILVAHGYSMSAAEWIEVTGVTMSKIKRGIERGDSLEQILPCPVPVYLTAMRDADEAAEAYLEAQAQQ